MRFRFSVRVILVVVTLAAVGLGWMANRFRIASSNQRVVAELRGMNAHATLDNGTVPTSDNSRGLGALSRRRITSVVNVTSDDVLERMTSLTDLRRVGIWGPVTDNGLANLQNATSLTELRIKSDQITVSGLRELTNAGGMEVLELSGKRFTDDCLLWASKFTGLKELHLSGPGFTDSGIKHISELRGLRSLFLGGTLVTNDGLADLSKSTDLQKVELSDTCTVGGLAHLIMDLQGREFGEWFPAEVVRDPDSDRVYVGLFGRRVQDDAVPFLLRGIPELTELELDSTAITSNGLKALGGLPNLKHLALRDSDASVVEGFPGLECLSLISFGGKSLPIMRNLPSLQAIAFAGAHLDGSVASSETDEKFLGNGLAHVVELGSTTPTLRTLVFDRSAIGDKHIAQIAAMKLTHLNLSGTEITDEGVSMLSEMSSLTHLNLGSTGITDDSLRVLSSLPNLESLQIRGTNVSDRGIPELQAAQRIRYLGLSWNRQLTDASIGALKSLVSLRELGLMGTGVTKAGCAELRETLEGCRILH